MRCLLDACVLYPTVTREILLGFAAEGMFRPLWSARILEEWARATRKLGPGAETVARGEIALLEAAWPAAAIIPRPGDLARLHLPDPDDVHVLAAAIAGSADVIVTFNAADFPRGTLAAEGLARQAPDELAMRLHEIVPGAVRAVCDRVHAKAENLSGEAIPRRALLKRAKLPRLGRALERAG